MTTIQKCNKAIEQQKPDEIYVLENHQLQDNKIYSKCPSCIRARKVQGWTREKITTELKNVFYKKQKEVFKTQNGEKIITFEEYYVCSECGKSNTVQDYVDLWCKDYTKKQEYS